MRWLSIIAAGLALALAPACGSSDEAATEGETGIETTGDERVTEGEVEVIVEQVGEE